MNKEKKQTDEPIEKKKCGIIMPIAPTPDYPKEHWKEVLSIIVDAISETEFEARLVSEDVAIGLIHERIVNNIYNDEIVICDVSSKNPNVMFELGMRLAFDKPTIIIKDENTGYSFDTGVIEHLNYPSSLRFNKIVEFKKELVKRINATYKKSIETESFSPFLKSFGKTIVPAKINNTEIPESKYIISKLESISNEIQFINSRVNNYEGNSLSNYLNNELSNTTSVKRLQARKTINEFMSMNSHFDKADIDLVANILESEIFAPGRAPKRELIYSELERYFYFKEKKA